MNQKKQKPFKISTTFHGVIDYIFVLYLVITPLLLKISDFTKMITFSMALVHLLLTLSTNFKLGIFRMVSFKIHGIIELVVSLLLIIIAFFLEHIDGNLARNFYLINGICVFLTWLITDYHLKEK